MLGGRILDEVAALAPVLGEWRQLAEGAGNPFVGPDWTLAWWRRSAPPGARLAVCVAEEDGRLVGVLPCYRTGGIGRAGILGAGIGQSLEPLAVAGRERETAAALVPLILGGRGAAATLSLEWIAADSPWPGWLAGACPGRRGAVLGRPAIASPIVELRDDSFDAWLARRARAVRKGLRRKQRRLEDEGMVPSRVAVEDVPSAIDALIALNAGRWSSQGLPATITPPMEAVLRAEAGDLCRRGVLSLWALGPSGGPPVAVEAVLHAGDRVALWQGGFDMEWSRYSPSRVLLAAIVGAAIEEGRREIDMGPGDQAYKDEFADRRPSVRHVLVAGRGARYLATWPRLAALRARDAATARLAPERRARLRAAARGLRLRP